MKTAAIIVAAGRGHRAGGDIPKQWQSIAGRRVIDWTLDAFLAHPEIDQTAVVVHTDDMARLAVDERIIITPGGPTRNASVFNGLRALKGHGIQKVLIHDVARPCITEAIITDVLKSITVQNAAAPALAVTDALWRGRNGTVDGTQDRRGLWRAQTPQGFDYQQILSAHKAFSGTAADDVEIARAFGIDVSIVDGHENNIKITTPDDFARAENILINRTRGPMDIRVGNGFDVHAFCPGDHVVLCGVKVPHTMSLLGHSDADVAMHAVTDAIYGALAEGDIGRHFPPSDPQWQGAASDIFLRHAVELATDRGYGLSNVDCTLVCEHPKIGPHAHAMQIAMASIMSMPVDRVSIKATTSERLGFTGREEGIAAMATVTLIKPALVTP